MNNETKHTLSKKLIISDLLTKKCLDLNSQAENFINQI